MRFAAAVAQCNEVVSAVAHVRHRAEVEGYGVLFALLQLDVGRVGLCQKQLVFAVLRTQNNTVAAHFHILGKSQGASYHGHYQRRSVFRIVSRKVGVVAAFLLHVHFVHADFVEVFRRNCKLCVVALGGAYRHGLLSRFAADVLPVVNVAFLFALLYAKLVTVVCAEVEVAHVEVRHVLKGNFVCGVAVQLEAVDILPIGFDNTAVVKLYVVFDFDVAKLVDTAVFRRFACHTEGDVLVFRCRVLLKRNCHC